MKGRVGRWPVDMRNGFTGLERLIFRNLGEDPPAADMCVFRSSIAAQLALIERYRAQANLEKRDY